MPWPLHRRSLKGSGSDLPPCCTGEVAVVMDTPKRDYTPADARRLLTALGLAIDYGTRTTVGAAPPRPVGAWRFPVWCCLTSSRRPCPDHEVTV